MGVVMGGMWRPTPFPLVSSHLGSHTHSMLLTALE